MSDSGYEMIHRIIFSEVVPCVCLVLVGCIYLHICLQNNRERRNDYSKEKRCQLEVQEKIIESLCDVFLVSYFIDIERDYYNGMTKKSHIQSVVEMQGKASWALRQLNEEMAMEKDLAKMRQFLEVSTLQSRMRTEDLMSCEFEAKNIGWCKVSFIKVKRNELGVLQQVMCIVRGIEKEKQKELEAARQMEELNRELNEALESQNVMYAQMLQMQETGVIALRAQDQALLYMNEAADRMLEWNQVPIQEQNINTLWKKLYLKNKHESEKRLKDMNRPGDRYKFECEIQQQDQSDLYVVAQAKVVELSDKMLIKVISFADVTNVRNMQKELLRLSEMDGLTGIYNRGSGQQKVEELLERRVAGTLCLLDCDRFKLVNDTYGHIVGDKVLKEIATALKQSFRKTDIVLRLGGDEFAFYIVGADQRATAEICLNKFVNVLEKIEISEIKGQKIYVSIGAVCYNEREEIKEFDELYQCADSCLYQSKKKKGNYITFWEEE